MEVMLWLEPERGELLNSVTESNYPVSLWLKDMEVPEFLSYYGDSNISQTLGGKIKVV